MFGLGMKNPTEADCGRLCPNRAAHSVTHYVHPGSQMCKALYRNRCSRGCKANDGENTPAAFLHQSCSRKGCSSCTHGRSINHHHGGFIHHDGFRPPPTTLSWLLPTGTEAWWASSAAQQGPASAAWAAARGSRSWLAPVWGLGRPGSGAGRRPASPPAAG